MTEALFFVFTATTIGAIIVEIKHKLHANAETLANRLRVRSWLAIIAICLAVFYSGIFALELFVTTLATWGTFEVLSGEKVKHKLSWLTLVAISTFLIQSIILQSVLWGGLIASLSLFLVAASTLLKFKRRPRTLLTIFYLMTSLSSLSAFYFIAERWALITTDLFVMLFLVVGLNDVFQYVCGKSFGKTKLAPNTSPSKTMEGAFGGVILTTILVGTLAYIYNFEGTWFFALLGASLSIAGLLGDLHFSALKRIWNVKHSGSGIPGHGGILDRIDSLTLVIPVFVIIAIWFGR